MARGSSPLVPLLAAAGVLATVVVLTLVMMGGDGPGDADSSRGGANRGDLIAGAQEDRALELPTPATGGEAQPLRGTPSTRTTPRSPAADHEPRGERERLAGTIVRRSDGTPVAGAMVYVAGEAAGDIEVSARTESNGAFELAEAPVDVDALWLAMPTRRLPLSLAEGGSDRTALVLVADTGWQIEGVVLDASGAPVRDAVVAVREGSDVRLAVGTSDATGAFVVHDVWPANEETTRVEVAASGAFHTERGVRISLPESVRRIEGLRLELTAGGAVEGRVIRSDGRPAGGAIVDLAWRDDNGWLEDGPAVLAATASEADGTYRIGGVPEGRYVALLRRGEGMLSSRFPEKFPAGAVEVALAVDVRSHEVTFLDWTLADEAHVSGRVIDGAGNPIGSASVVAHWEFAVPAPGRVGTWITEIRGGVAESTEGPGGKQSTVRMQVGSAVTAADGHYTLGDLPAGRVLFDVASDDHRGVDGRTVRTPSVSVDTVAGQSLSGIDLIVGGGAAIRGQVVDVSGRALPEATVAITKVGPTYMVTNDDFAPVADDGRFAFEGLEPGKHIVHAFCPGYRGWSKVAEADGPELRVEMLGAPVLSGRVRDGSDLKPVTTYDIRVEDESTFMEAEWSHAEGRFLIDSFEEGTYTLTISADGYVDLVRAGLEVRFGVPVDLDLLLVREGGG